MTDACTDVKADLKAGTFTNYGSDDIPIYIENRDPFKGKGIYITLKDAFREPVQTVDGTILFTKRGCTITIVANTTTNRDNIYDDIVSILTATSRGYTFKREKDQPQHKKRLDLSIIVSMML